MEVPKHVKELIAGGFSVRYHNINGQEYVEVENLETGGAPWNRSTVNILVTIPNNFATGVVALDAFYADRTLLLGSEKHPRMQSEHTIDSRLWWLISWHYIKPWQPGKDSLLTHVFHCRQFFKQKGRTN